MKFFQVWRTRIWPQCYMGLIQAKDIDEAFAIAKQHGILNPIVGSLE